MTAPACFNCGTTEDVAAYSLDLDLPAIPACPVCWWLLMLRDEEMLAALRPKRRRSKGVDG